jgi:RNA polymerase primary sigma factor
MASEIKVMLQKAGRETPVLDLSDAAVKELVRTAKKRGYIAHDQINALLASEEIDSEQIENILAKFSEMGVNVVETKEPRLEEEVTDREEPDEKGENRRRERVSRNPTT